MRKLVLLVALAAATLFCTTDLASGWGGCCYTCCDCCCYTPCWYPCCPPCPPCHSCWGKAFKDPGHPDPKYWNWVYFPCCPTPNYLARWYVCWIWENGTWHYGWALVFWVDWSGQAMSGAPTLAASAPAPDGGATLIVTLPADATVYIDDYRTVSASAERVYHTPPLQAGKTFSYTLKAEVMRAGKVVAVSREVDVRAGQETRVRLDFPASVAAAE